MATHPYDAITTDEWKIFLTKARDLGVPQDQITNFLNYYYLPLPWQMKFHAIAREADHDGGPVKIGAGGARGPGKSHAVFAQIALDDCQRFAGIKALFLRQTGKSAQESFEDLINKVIKQKIPYKYNSSKGLLTFNNGSKVLLGGFENEKDVDKYVGIEYDVIGIEELNQLTENKVEKLEGSLRTSKEGWRPRMYTSFNPGGIGHAFVRSTYVLPYRAKQESTTRFIPSSYKDNVYLNKEYISYLEGLKGDLGKAWREGEWEIFAGQFFSEWREHHTCNPFIPSTMNVIIGGMDWGRTGREKHQGAFAFHLAEVSRVDYDGRKFHRVRPFLEVYGKDKTPAQWYEVIAKKMKFYNVRPQDIAWIMADNKMFSPQDDNRKSISDQFKDASREFGLRLKPCTKDRIGGWENFHTWLQIAPDGIPYYQASTDCHHFIRTIPELIHDDLKVEDIDTDGEDHIADEQQYMLKKLKFIDGGVGPVTHPKATTSHMQRTAHFIGERQVGINTDLFAPQDARDTKSVGPIIRK